MNEDKLSAVLGEFARTMITDFPIQRILDRLVERIVGVLPVTSAGVTLIAEGSTPHYIAASDDSARTFERLQTEIGEGPCLESFHTGHPVALPDLAADVRLPRFSPAGVEAGLGAREEALATSDRFYHDAMHDPLTGLPNRLLLQERLEHAALRAQRAHTYTAVLFLDLDRFKQVNDAHGHHIGDELLRAVAQRLSTLVRGGDTLSRFSGDEFVLLCEELGSVSDVSRLVARIEEMFVEPFELGGVDVVVRTSVGVAYAGPGEAVTSDLLTSADLDMYRAKRDGAGVEVAQPISSRSRLGEQRLEDDVRRAMDAGQLEVAYQPIVRTSDDSVAGVEALVRWNHPHRGPVAPLTLVIETEIQRTESIAVGCDYTQGYPHARPMRFDDITKLLAASRVGSQTISTPR